MSQIDPDQLKVILATDCGSTTTKAILIQYVDGEYRQTHRGEAPTTVEKPFANVTAGVLNSVSEIGELAGRRLVDDDGHIISPATETEGCDIYISTSSAGGGLQMMVAGVIAEMTAASVQHWVQAPSLWTSSPQMMVAVHMIRFSVFATCVLT
jgi:hypothetical protein